MQGKTAAETKIILAEKLRHRGVQFILQLLQKLEKIRPDLYQRVDDLVTTLEEKDPDATGPNTMVAELKSALSAAAIWAKPEVVLLTAEGLLEAGPSFYEDLMSDKSGESEYDDMISLYLNAKREEDEPLLAVVMSMAMGENTPAERKIILAEKLIDLKPGLLRDLMLDLTVKRPDQFPFRAKDLVYAIHERSGALIHVAEVMLEINPHIIEDIDTGDAVRRARIDTMRPITILNASGGRVSVHWIDPDTGEKVLQSDPDLLNGAYMPLTSYVNHMFLVRELPGKTGVCAGVRGQCRIARFTVNPNTDQSE